MSGEEIILTADNTETHYQSNKTWEQLRLPPELIHKCQLKEWQFPTLIQSHAIPRIIRGESLVAQSKNGTGKSGAYVLGTLCRVEPNDVRVQVLCISHTRELNQQNFGIFKEFADQLGIRVGIAEKRMSSIPACHVLCGTIGSLRNVVNERNKRTVDGIRIVVYDEADYLMDHPDTSGIITNMRQTMRNDTQQILFSATYTNEVQDFIKEFIPVATRILIPNVEDLTLDNVTQCFMQCGAEEKFMTVNDILNRVQLKTCIIFINTKDKLDQLHQYLAEQGHISHVIAAGRVDDNVRDAIIDRAQRGLVKILLTTNVLSRGFDIRSINLVINFDPPLIFEYGVIQSVRPDPVTYLHRVGRTGRANRKGISVNLVENDRIYNTYSEICQYYNVQLNEVTLDELTELVLSSNVDYGNEEDQ